MGDEGVALAEPLTHAGPVHAVGVGQPDQTYGHLLPDVLDRTRTALDTFLAAPAAGAGESAGFGP